MQKKGTKIDSFPIRRGNDLDFSIPEKKVGQVEKESKKETTWLSLDP